MTPEEHKSRRRTDALAKYIYLERLARQAANGNTKAINAIPEAKTLWNSARAQFIEEFGYDPKETF